MGAYLSQPVTEKELYFGSNKSLEYGGASMQGWRKSMEDAHIAVLNLGNNADTAMFGVFDGHGGSEVAKFCQRYMAEEITKLEHYHQGRLGDSLIEVFHKIDHMLKDQQYVSELETWKRSQHEKPSGETQSLAPNQNEQVSNTEAVHLLRQVLALRGKQGAKEETPQQEDSDPSEPSSAMDVEDTTSPSNRPIAELPNPSDPNLAPLAAADLAASDPTIESTATRVPLKARSPNLDLELGGGGQIQAGCTAVVAVFQGDQLYVANAGDSRAVLCRGPDAVALSEDHKPASEAERERIHAAGGYVISIGGVYRVTHFTRTSTFYQPLVFALNQPHVFALMPMRELPDLRVNGNLNLSRAIGDLKYKSNDRLSAADQIISAQPDVTETRLGPNDWFLVLACDGVWDVKTNQEVVDFVSQRLSRGMSPSETASQLLDACLATDPADTRGIGCDNMTATIVIVRSHGDGPSKAQQMKPDE